MKRLSKKLYSSMVLALFLALVLVTLVFADTVLNPGDVAVVGHGSASTTPLIINAGNAGTVSVTFVANDGTIPAQHSDKAWITVPQEFEIGESGEIAATSDSQTQSFSSGQNFSHNSQSLTFVIQVTALSNAPAGLVHFPVTFTHGDQVKQHADFSAPHIYVEVVVLGGYDIDAFKNPVKMDGATNSVKAGSTVPLKFTVTDAGGAIQSETEMVTFQTAGVSCGLMAPESNDIQEESTGGTTLRFDVDDEQFIQNWKVPAGANKCYSVRVLYDGTWSDWAIFRTK
jgi:hypothetical protein